MSSVNKNTLMGFIGQDPEVKTLENGVKVAKINLATTERFKDKEGNRKEYTDWHNLELWGKLADVAEKYLKKGAHIYVEGPLKYDIWDDENGTKHKRAKIKVNTLKIVSSKTQDETQSPTQANISTEKKGSDDELPF